MPNYEIYSHNETRGLFYFNSDQESNEPSSMVVPNLFTKIVN